MTSKKTIVVGGRVPHKIAKEMEQEGLKVPECVQIALQTKRDPQKLMRAQLKDLLSEQELLASRLGYVNYAIDDLLNKLNIDKSLDELKDELFMDDNEKAIQTTLDRFEMWRGESNFTIYDYVETPAGKRVIDIQLARCDLTKEDFINLLFERHDKSIQTKLDI